MESGLKKLLITISIFILIAIIFSVVRSYNARKDYKKQIEKLEVALKEWGEQHTDFLPEKNGETITIPLSTLKQAGLINTRFTNPKERSNFSNQLLMTITKTKEGYQYKILDQDENMAHDYDDVNMKAPMIVLKGEEIEYAELNEPYEESGYYAVTKDGKAADEMRIELKKDGKAVARVDTSKLNTYEVTYYFSYAKEESKITRLVEVKDTLKPTVTMDRLTVSVEEAKNVDLMKDVEISDNSKGKLKVEIIGTVAAIPGRYVITYKVTDPSGNVTEKKRVVRVEETLEELPEETISDDVE